MINKIPDLFERNFFIGYFLPTGIAILVFDLILKSFNIPSVLEKLNPQSSSDILLTTTFFSLISWIGGIVLLSTNREILRIFEGYGQLNPTRLFAFVERYYFRKLKSQIYDIDKQYLKFVEKGKTFPADFSKRRNNLMLKAVKRFPAEEKWLLPTAFGNVIRAFETYSYMMYGVDAIPVWQRLIAIVPDHYQRNINDAKALVDLWINLCTILILAMLEYIYLAIHFCQVLAPIIPILIIVFFLITYERSQAAAIQWGEVVKATFDLYLPSLMSTLGFSNNYESKDKQREIWSKFSQAVVYANAKYMPDRVSQEDE